MKETIKINLNGQLFDLDNDAYEALHNYLESIKGKFGNTPEEADEILEDIESRIAEILQQKLTKVKQVITLGDIKEIISLLGTADDMDADEEAENKENVSGKYHNQEANNKRFYRDPENRVIGGVCTGLSAYFNIDVIWIRLIFIFLFFAKFAGLIIYVVLWIVLPPAKTTAQRLEMQGKRFTLDDIEESVKKEYSKVKSSVKNIPNSKEYKNIESGLSEFFSVLGNILLVFFKVIGAIILVSLILTLVISVLGLVVGSITFLPWQFFDSWEWPHVIDVTSWSLIGICLFLVIAMPILALLTNIVRWLFNIESRNRVSAGIGATIWVLAFISLVVLLVKQGENKAFRAYDTTSYKLTLPENKTLYIGLNSDDFEDYHLRNYQVFNYRFSYDKYSDDFFKEPGIQIKTSEDEKIRLEIQKEFNSFRIGHVHDYPEELIDYNWHMSDTMLVLDKFYSCDDDDAWLLPNVQITLFLPAGQKVNFDDSVERLLDVDYAPVNRAVFEDGMLKGVKN
jgi:phage shock protein PspC (stress-responsive transcriptional regulator)